jgi:hypothetical protein
MADEKLIDKLMVGMIDTHIHCNPHYGGKKNLDALEAARQAERAQMKAIVLKCGTFPSSGSAYLVSKLVNNVKVFGGITLNRSVGGLNPVAVEKAILYGEGNPGEYTKIIWMPTVDAANHVKHDRRPEAETVHVIRNGRLVPEVCAILELIAKYDLALATAHLEPAEIFPLIEEAKTRGVNKILITHPHNVTPYIPIPRQLEMANMGAFIEQCYVMATKYYGDKYHFMVSVRRIAEDIKDVGAERCILATDFGADSGQNPSPAEGIRIFIQELLEKGISENEIEKMKSNAAFLLGLS